MEGLRFPACCWSLSCCLPCASLLQPRGPPAGMHTLPHPTMHATVQLLGTNMIFYRTSAQRAHFPYTHSSSIHSQPPDQGSDLLLGADAPRDALPLLPAFLLACRLPLFESCLRHASPYLRSAPTEPTVFLHAAICRSAPVWLDAALLRATCACVSRRDARSDSNPATICWMTVPP